MTGKTPAKKPVKASAKKPIKNPTKTNVRLKRAYDQPADGKRILVDRLWPRGVKKDAAAIDQWAKDIAPSDALRTWFGHDPAR